VAAVFDPGRQHPWPTGRLVCARVHERHYIAGVKALSIMRTLNGPTIVVHAPSACGRARSMRSVTSRSRVTPLSCLQSANISNVASDAEYNPTNNVRDH